MACCESQLPLLVCRYPDYVCKEAHASRDMHLFPGQHTICPTNISTLPLPEVPSIQMKQGFLQKFPATTAGTRCFAC